MGLVSFCYTFSVYFVMFNITYNSMGACLNIYAVQYLLVYTTSAGVLWRVSAWKVVILCLHSFLVLTVNMTARWSKFLSGALSFSWNGFAKVITGLARPTKDILWAGYYKLEAVLLTIQQRTSTCSVFHIAAWWNVSIHYKVFVCIHSNCYDRRYIVHISTS